MSDCCEDILAELEAIKDAVTCICPSLADMRQQTTISENWPELPDTTDYFDWSNTEPNPTIEEQADEEACTLAQCWYQAGLELITETVLPTFRFSFDALVPAVAALLVVITGGAALPVFIGVYLGAELFEALLGLAYDSAETNLVNWLWTAKEDLVCLMYNELRLGGEGADMWGVVYDALVADAVDLSAGDKLIVNRWMGGIALSAAETAIEEESPWVDTASESGFCDGCDILPIVGDDWIAIEYTGPYNPRTIYHPPGSSWVGSCTAHDLPGTATCVGMFFEVTDVSGDCDIKAVHGPDAGCTGVQSYVPNNPYLLSEGWYYYRDEWNHDHDEAVAEVHPGSTQVAQWSNPAQYLTSLAWMLGWNCEGSATFTIKYLVFAGTTPP